jgi:diphthamide synthase (EF-2-diphthine--ammonia ligase)
VGREFDADLLNDLPSNVDPCGENGEFHTFCKSGPDCAWDINVVLGDVHQSDGFVFRDLRAAEDDRQACS